MKYLLSIVIALALIVPAFGDTETPLPLKDFDQVQQTEENVGQLSVEPKLQSEEEAAEEKAAEGAATEEEAATEGEEAAGISLDSFKGAMQRNPIVWAVLALILTIFTCKGAKSGVSALYARLKDHVSPGEIGGTATLIGGALALSNGVGLAAGWSSLISNLIVGGILALIVGAGICAKGYENRTTKKD